MKSFISAYPHCEASMIYTVFRIADGSVRTPWTDDDLVRPKEVRKFMVRPRDRPKIMRVLPYSFENMRVLSYFF